MSEILKYVSKKRVNAEGLERFLNNLKHRQRVDATRALPQEAFPWLFEGVKGFRPVFEEDFVHRGTLAMTPVIHVGTNNLPFFREFNKVMYRQPNGVIAGRNEQTMEWLTGPGYFIVDPRLGDKGEIAFDYTRLPELCLPKWPKIKSNDSGFSVFVYRGLIDVMRRVSDHVTVGRAFRGGKPLSNYFILVRKS